MAFFSTQDILAKPVENYVWDENTMAWVKQTQGGAAGGGLTDAELRASPVPVSIPGSITVSGPLTDTELRATPVQVEDATGNAFLNVLVNSIDVNFAQRVNIETLGGSGGVPIAVSNGGVSLGTQRVTLANDSTGQVRLAAGTAIAGRVGIDQTTPGTTNKVTLGADSVAVTGPLTDAQLRATPVPVSGTVAISTALALETTQLAQMSRVDTFKTRGDTFTTTVNGVTVDASLSPMSAFGIQVKATGTVTSWDMRLEGSLNNSEFSTILSHTNVTGDGVTLWTGTLEAPTLYFRARCAGIVLGAGTNVVVTILGQN